MYKGRGCQTGTWALHTGMTTNQYTYIATACPTAADVLDVTGGPAFLVVCLHPLRLLQHPGAVEPAAAPGSWGHSCMTGAQSVLVLCLGMRCPQQFWALLNCLCFSDGCLPTFQANLQSGLCRRWRWAGSRSPSCGTQLPLRQLAPPGVGKG